MLPHGNLRGGLVGAFCPSLSNYGPLLRDESPLTRSGSHTGTWQTTAGRAAISVSGGTTLSMASTPSVVGGDFTVAFWYYQGSLASGYAAIVDKGNGGTREFSVFYTTSGGSTSLVVIGGTFSGTAVSWGITASQWQHLAMTRSGSTVTYYRNGVNRGTHTLSGTTPVSGSVWSFGANTSGGGNNINGAYDDVRIWTRCLAASEIGTLATRPGIGLVPTRIRRVNVLGSQFWLRDAGTWKKATGWIKVNGVWTKATPKLNVSGTWK